MPAPTGNLSELCLELSMTRVTRAGMLPRHRRDCMRMRREKPTRIFTWQARYRKDAYRDNPPPTSRVAARAGTIAFASNENGVKTLSRLGPTTSGPMAGRCVDGVDGPSESDSGQSDPSERRIEVAWLC